jgi:hypothetical protein
VFDSLNTYVATMHFNGQCTVSLDGDRATGESYCLAHHLSVAEDGQRTLMVASIRYLDEFVKLDGQWLFAERRLMVNWIDTRPSAPDDLAGAACALVLAGTAFLSNNPRQSRKMASGARYFEKIRIIGGKPGFAHHWHGLWPAASYVG